MTVLKVVMFIAISVFLICAVDDMREARMQGGEDIVSDAGYW